MKFVSQGSWNKLWDERLSDFYEKKNTYWACLFMLGLNDIFHWYALLEILIKSPFSCNNDRLTSLATEKIEVSSAKILAIDDRFLDKSLIYTKNNRGPKMDPWGNGDHEHATDHLTRLFEIYLIGSSHCILVVGPIYS